jgi:hypothetical protein
VEEGRGKDEGGGRRKEKTNRKRIKMERIRIEEGSVVLRQLRACICRNVHRNHHCPERVTALCESHVSAV